MSYRRPLFFIFIVLALVLVWWGVNYERAGVRPDQTVILFPSFAQPSADGKTFHVPIHGWLYELEADSRLRGKLIEELAERLGVEPGDAQGETFKKRAQMFLVDNEDDKRLAVRLGSVVGVMEKVKDNGHFYGTMTLPAEEVKDRLKPGLQTQVVMLPGDNRRFTGLVSAVGNVGVSVVSDIDDTIKITEVGDRKKMIQNTFVKPYEAVPGMAKLYQRWADRGAVFHYVSGSPWQLYPALAEFMAGAGFPPGEFDLKYFRWTDSSVLDLRASPEKTKPPVIEAILKRWPGRKFIFVGDSGEKDPEVYGELARRHPAQVLHIFIRDVKPDATDKEGKQLRFEKAFKDLPADLWTVFTDPGKVAEKVKMNNE